MVYRLRLIEPSPDAEHIAVTSKNGDGYLFAKSVKMLPETEKTWVLLDQDYKENEIRMAGSSAAINPV